MSQDEKKKWEKEIKMDTREAIKKTALKMFNEEGVSNVSTVRLAETLGISPGNLYYYYENKEHIIRSIWEEDIIPAQTEVMEGLDLSKPDEAAVRFIKAMAETATKYIFIYTEFYVIMRNDPRISKLYKERNKRGSSILMKMFEAGEASGLFVPVEKEEKKMIIQSFWCIVTSQVGLNKTLNPSKSKKTLITELVENIFMVMKPYIQPDKREKLMDALKEEGYYKGEQTKNTKGTGTKRQ